MYLVHCRGETYGKIIVLSSDSSHVVQNQVMPLIGSLVKEYKA
jgi:hypothetical protein